MISKAHYAQILSCSILRVNVWFTRWLIFLGYRLVSPIFSIALWIWFGLPHPSIVGIFWSVFTHPINPMGIHLLRCAHGSEHIRTHDAIRDTFVVIMQDVGFPHGVRTTTCASFKHIQFLSSTNQHCVHQRWHFSWHYHCRPNTSDLLRQSCATQGFASLMQFKPKNKIITTDTPLINSSPEQWRYLDVYISKWMCSYTIVPMPFGV